MLQTNSVQTIQPTISNYISGIFCSCWIWCEKKKKKKDGSFEQKQKNAISCFRRFSKGYFVDAYYRLG